MTSLEQERVEQRRWTERLKQPFPYFDTLVEGEFLPADQIRENQAAALGRMLHFASECVPYYRDLVQKISIDAEDATPFRVLEALPILNKLGLQDKLTALRAERLPKGERAVIEVGTSGTTGIPARGKTFAPKRADVHAAQAKRVSLVPVRSQRNVRPHSLSRIAAEARRRHGTAARRNDEAGRMASRKCRLRDRTRHRLQHHEHAGGSDCVASGSSA
jgi:hypothetical protein